MNLNSLFILLLCLFVSINTQAQIAVAVNDMETAHKECLKIKSDSNNCSKMFLSQMDSMLNVVFNEVVKTNPSDKKSSLLKEQMSWSKKKGEFYKKQDETFVYNLKDGIWTKDMIRISYQQKADFLLKRIRALLKQIR